MNKNFLPLSPNFCFLFAENSAYRRVFTKKYFGTPYDIGLKMDNLLIMDISIIPPMLHIELEDHSIHSINLAQPEFLARAGFGQGQTNPAFRPGLPLWIRRVIL